MSDLSNDTKKHTMKSHETIPLTLHGGTFNVVDVVALSLYHQGEAFYNPA
jgi:hypothetical protein